MKLFDLIKRDGFVRIENLVFKLKNSEEISIDFDEGFYLEFSKERSAWFLKKTPEEIKVEINKPDFHFNGE